MRRIKWAIIITITLVFINHAAFSELNLKPKAYEKGDQVEDQCIALSPGDWQKVVEEIQDSRRIIEIREQQLQNQKDIEAGYTELLKVEEEKSILYKENADLCKQEMNMYKEETERYQNKYLSLIKWNSVRTGFIFTAGVGVTLLAGWIFNEIAN